MVNYLCYISNDVTFLTMSYVTETNDVADELENVADALPGVHY